MRVTHFLLIAFFLDKDSRPWHRIAVSFSGRRDAGVAVNLKLVLTPQCLQRTDSVKKEDLLLVERCKQGDQIAYGQLVRKYQGSVFNLCRKMVRNPEEARDLAQEAFVKTFASLERYNPVYAFSSWLFKITSNLCIDHIRKQRMKLFSIDDPVEGEEGPILRELADPGHRPDAHSEHSELREAIRAAIDQLPEHYRVILILRHQEQLSYEEIAQSLGIPLGTVKARIHRAREGLKVQLAAYAP